MVHVYVIYSVYEAHNICNEQRDRQFFIFYISSYIIPK